jgi:hypothetical protein
MLDVPASHKRAWRKARVVGSNGTKKKSAIWDAILMAKMKIKEWQ